MNIYSLINEEQGNEKEGNKKEDREPPKELCVVCRKNNIVYKKRKLCNTCKKSS